MTKMRKNYILLFLLALLFLASTVVCSVDVEAKSDVKCKLVSLKQKSGKVYAKIKIMNGSKNFIEISDELVMYEKKNHKWKKIKWNRKHSVSDSLFGLEAGEYNKYTFIINPDELMKKLKPDKYYRLGIEIDGKYKKTKKFKIRKKYLKPQNRCVILPI